MTERPRYSDCGLFTAFRTSVTDPRLNREVRVYQCPNCARVIWAD